LVVNLKAAHRLYQPELTKSSSESRQDAAAEAIAAAGEFLDPEARRDEVEPDAAAASEK
jgi:large subunit ribosomal protein L9